MITKTRTRIGIKPDSVCFSRIEHGRVYPNSTVEVEIDDSANLSYIYVNVARRELALRFVGMQEGTCLPIWELTVSWPDDGLIVMTEKIVGYGDFDHEGNSLRPVVHPMQLQVAA